MGGCLWKLVILLFLTVNVNDVQSHQLESIWAKKLGDELWHLSQVVTKHSVIKSKYRTLNAAVDRNDGRSLLNQIIENIGKMVQTKVTAVKCLVAAAEKLAEEYELDGYNRTLEYYSMKFSPANGIDYTTFVTWKLDNVTTYKDMALTPNRNFYNIPVNTSFSGVHIPTNLFDRYPHVQESINWSEDLDEIFRRNYQQDQSLNWQYFGTSSGMMRQYPAMHWKTREEDVDLYDCRTRPWFIEAATCTKDVIILMDNSGSMTGMRNTIAKLVVKNILETFGNNDYINVLKFSWTAEPVLPCYSDILVQGTSENIEMFREAVLNIKPEGNASFPNAFATAFKLLEKFRDEKQSVGEGNSNQAIMLVTDGLPGNITDVFEMYNFNSSVRVFTYLVGNEVKGVDELQQMACHNRGYYVHIHNLDEVRDQVLKYIPVIARPMVMYGEHHPVIWTHIFADAGIQGEEKQMEYQEYRMATTISMPAFNNRSAIPELLGVAGTDVPVDYFYSLTYPYKIGANGYAFIITNNGYIILHPELRPVFDGTLKTNFESVDLAEVEFADDDAEYKEFNSSILELRNGMVNMFDDSLLDVDIKFVYDDMRRVWIDKRDYYYSPLPGTPFSIGLAIPSDYGDNQIGVGDVIKKNFHQGIRLYKFLKDKDKKDNQWRIHPDWVYCKYFNASHRYFETAEDELLHFLEKMSWEGKKFKTQYRNTTEEDFDYDESCVDDGQQPQEDAYYCDEDLIQLVLFDAQVTEPFRNPKLHKNEYEEKLLKTYKATLRFVSTQSGLTRWQLIPKPVDNQTSDFGNAYPRAIDESWYKAAVLQHQIDRESFVFSVPFTAADMENPLITATHAIFPVDGGKEAPASVVGFQFTQKSLHNRFIELTKMKVDDIMSGNESRICYILDHNGYIILSTSEDNVVGTFFGATEGEVMTKLVEEGIFRKIDFFDYQGLCFEEYAISSDASIILKPWTLLYRLIEFLTVDLTWYMLKLFTYQAYNVHSVFTSPVEESGESYDEEDFTDYEEKPNVTISIHRNSWPCDKKLTLFLLNHDAKPLHTNGKSRLNHAEKIPHTNLVLISLNNSFEKDEGIVITLEPTVLPIESCHRAYLNDLPRKRLPSCYTYHPLEEEIQVCGRGVTSTINLNLIVISCIITYVINKYW